jgi:hypothetical protein
VSCDGVYGVFFHRILPRISLRIAWEDPPNGAASTPSRRVYAIVAVHRIGALKDHLR